MDDSSVQLIKGTGTVLLYDNKDLTTGYYQPGTRDRNSLVRNPDGTWVETQPDGFQLFYALAGPSSSSGSGSTAGSGSWSSSGSRSRSGSGSSSGSGSGSGPGSNQFSVSGSISESVSGSGSGQVGSSGGGSGGVSGGSGSGSGSGGTVTVGCCSESLPTTLHATVQGESGSAVLTWNPADGRWEGTFNFGTPCDSPFYIALLCAKNGDAYGFVIELSWQNFTQMASCTGTYTSSCPPSFIVENDKGCYAPSPPPNCLGGPFFVTITY